MGTPINSNYSFTGYGPLDEKLLVDAFGDLPSNPHNGMIVAVDNEHCAYIYDGSSWIKLADIDYVEEAVANIQSGGSIDLSQYAKKSELNAYALKTDIPDISDFISAIPSEYITESELESKGYITEHQSLENYATNESVRESIESVEEKIPSLDGYATELFVTQKIAEAQLSGGEADLSAYATKEYVDTQISQIAIPEIPSKLSDLNNDIGYITESAVDDKIAAALNSEDIDLTDYYTKDEVKDLIDSYFANIKQAEDEEF